jgi:hypothetical protein
MTLGNCRNPIETWRQILAASGKSAERSKRSTAWRKDRWAMEQKNGPAYESAGSPGICKLPKQQCIPAHEVCASLQVITFGSDGVRGPPVGPRTDFRDKLKLSAIGCYGLD